MLEIKDWVETFETSTESRRPRGAMTWCQIPVDNDSGGKRKLFRMGKDGYIAYSVFVCLIQWTASKPIELRGKLGNSDGSSFTALDISELTRVDVESVEKSLEILLKIGWLIESEQEYNELNKSAQDCSGLNKTDQSRSKKLSTGQDRTGQDRTEQNRTQHNKTDQNATAKKQKKSEVEIPEILSSPEFEKIWSLYQSWWIDVTGKRLDDIKAQFQLMDLAKRGLDKSIADLKLTMERSTKPGSIWDSDKNFQGIVNANGKPERKKLRVSQDGIERVRKMDRGLPSPQSLGR